jgi:NCAIR mutase (PurE)-related protein
MEHGALNSILAAVADKSMNVETAMKKLSNLPFEDMGFARIDHHRALRKGYAEVIFCQNKTPIQVLAISKSLMSHGETVFGTRASKETLDLIKRKIRGSDLSVAGRCFWKKSKLWKKRDNVKGTIVIASAGTADLPVVEEAKCTVEVLGHPCLVINDVGVAGIHRLFAHQHELTHASVIIVVAGMEGALPSVVAGLVGCPVIAVPTSVGYGSHLNGLVPLFAMLNSCASGMTVVNIDNGFGAGYAAALMNGK